MINFYTVTKIIWSILNDQFLYSHLSYSNKIYTINFLHTLFIQGNKIYTVNFCTHTFYTVTKCMQSIVKQ